LIVCLVVVLVVGILVVAVVRFHVVVFPVRLGVACCWIVAAGGFWYWVVLFARRRWPECVAERPSWPQ